MYIISKKVDALIEAAGGVRSSDIIKIGTPQFRHNRIDDVMEVSGYTYNDKCGFKFNDGRIGLYLKEKDLVRLWNFYDEDEVDLSLDEFLSDIPGYVSLLDSEKGIATQKRIREEEAAREKVEEEERRKKDFFFDKIEKKLKEKGMFKYKNKDGYERGIVRLSRGLGTGAKFTVWNGGWVGNKLNLIELFADDPNASLDDSDMGRWRGMKPEGMKTFGELYDAILSR